MKKNIFSKIVKTAGVSLILASALTPCDTLAQTLKSGYFTDGYIYRYLANPAYGYDQNFVSMPILGNTNFGTTGNIGVKHFIYNVNGRTTTYLNPGVSVDEVMNGLKDRMRIGTDISEQIMAVGFKAFGGYNTVTISARGNAGVFFPKDIVALSKEGVTNKNYNVGDMGAMGQAWGQIAFNHSRQITPDLRIGGAVKLLMGVGNMEAKFNRADLSLGEDNWTAEVDASLLASVKGLRYKNGYNWNTRRTYVNGIDADNIKPMNGFGVSFDLGVVYNYNKDWEFSVSFVDLGVIHWSETYLATTDGLQTIDTDKYTFEVKDDHSFDKLKDDLSKIYQLKDEGNVGGRTTAVGATMKFGARYTIPTFDKLNVGFLNTTRLHGHFSWTDFRVAANYTPIKWFTAGINLGRSTFGGSFGMILNLNLPYFNMFLASDHIPGKLAKQGVPLSSNLDFNMGINFPF